MFDFLHLPELTDNYFQSLLFVFSIVLVFFSADCWLLAKNPNTYRENIKLIDFLISRLRLIVPIVFLMSFIFMAITGSFQGGFFFGTVFPALSLYGSVFYFKYRNKYPKKNALVFWLFLILGTSVAVIVMRQYSVIGVISGIIGLVLYLFILDFIFRKIEKKEDNAIRD